MHSLLFTLLDSSLVLAGHGYDFSSSGGGQSGADDDGGGLSMEWIMAVGILALGTMLVLYWVNRREQAAVAGEPSGALKLKSVAPVMFTVAVIAAPLVLWTTSSGGDEKSLMVERWTNNDTGKPELLISLGEDDLNGRDTTNGEKTVRIQCRGRQGQAVLDVRQRWPFIKERGYEYPHAHQAASAQQVQQADRCRLSGIGVRLEAEVEGALTG